MSHRFFILGPAWTVNAERTMHWRKRAALTRQFRSDAKLLTKLAKVPSMERAHITLTCHQGPRGRIADPGAFYPTFKAIIDGIVDAGVIVDDTQDYLTMSMGANIRGVMRGVELVIEEAK